MALQPSNYSTQERLQPGARGEIFNPSLPGYRDGADRLNRTQNFMNVSEHDVPNIKYEFDNRLPVLFKYGFDYGFNQMVIPKGRIVAADQNMNLVDFESQKEYNTLTLANGGAPVRLRVDTDKYKDSSGSATALVSTASQGREVMNPKKDWIPVQGMETSYTNQFYRPFAKPVSDSGSVAEFYGAAAQLTDAGYTVDAKTGKVAKDGKTVDNVRSGNLPLGVLQRNEYTRDEDAFNGIMPGPILTDSMIEIPWFAYKDKAEMNPWGSAYGAFTPGAMVKSDENGRFTISPLSSEAAVASMSLAEYEKERQQVVGTIYSVNKNLIPEGAAVWAEWALEDKLNWEGFNPAIYAKNNRRGEDAVNSSPFNSEGKYPGYPFDKNYLNHDLHMLASVGRRDNYDPRMNNEFRYGEMGIPGLTDGKNVAVRDVAPYKAGIIHSTTAEYIDQFFRTLDVDIDANSLQIAIGDDAFTNCIVGAELHDAFRVKYASELQGIITIEIFDKAKADAFLASYPNGAEVKFKYKMRGLVGVPTFMDWDGCCGSVKILLQK